MLGARALRTDGAHLRKCSPRSLQFTAGHCPRGVPTGYPGRAPPVMKEARADRRAAGIGGGATAAADSAAAAAWKLAAADGVRTVACVGTHVARDARAADARGAAKLLAPRMLALRDQAAGRCRARSGAAARSPLRPEARSRSSLASSSGQGGGGGSSDVVIVRRPDAGSAGLLA